jgi:hypothetical protein
MSLFECAQPSLKYLSLFLGVFHGTHNVIPSHFLMAVFVLHCKLHEMAILTISEDGHD